MKVKGFLYNVRKVGNLSNMSDQEMLNLAECHLQDNAATWMMDLEEEGKKPESLDELEKMMLAEFVPSDERARARMKLMSLQQKKSIESHITTFQELVAVCKMPISETYLFFFLSLNGKFKEECTKQFPTGEPKSMKEVYNFARTIDRSIQWNPSEVKDGKGKDPKPNVKKVVHKESGSPPKKEDSTVSWGPAKKGERNLYRSKDRCFVCGCTGYKTKTCSCHEKSDENSDKNNDPKE